MHTLNELRGKFYPRKRKCPIKKMPKKQKQKKTKKTKKKNLFKKTGLKTSREDGRRNTC
jgi:hypothetical protein